MGTPDETMTSAIAGHQANIFVIHNSESLGAEDMDNVKLTLGDDLVLRDGEKMLTFATYGKDKEIASSVTFMAAQDIPVSDRNPVALLEDEAEVFRRVGAINDRAKVGEIPIPLKQRRFEAMQIFAAPNW